VTVVELRDALHPLNDMLASDGYSASVEEVGNDLVIRIAAGNDACAECLTPREVVSAVAMKLLRDAGVLPSEVPAIRILMPGDA
jgi:hypothetical protein